MAERKRLRERAAELTKKSVSLLKKLNPEPALSRLRLNHKLVRAISPLIINRIDINIVDWNLVKNLIVAGANPNMRLDDGNRTPLLAHAARFGDTKSLCRLLLEKGAKVDLKNKEGYTALAAAANDGHTDICKLLIENGANIEGYNKDGITPLMLAAQDGHTDTCALLIENGANIEVKNKKYGANSLMLAESGGRTEAVRILKLGLLLGKDGFRSFRANFRECVQ
jgi:ankyrin repeat protein